MLPLAITAIAAIRAAAATHTYAEHDQSDHIGRNISLGDHEAGTWAGTSK